jgi:hypothetical protein
VERTTVHRQFAGILATAAFTITVVRGLAYGSDAAAVLPRAAAMLVLFGLAGAVLGRVALWMVEEGVSANLREALAERSGKKP